MNFIIGRKGEIIDQRTIKSFKEFNGSSKLINEELRKRLKDELHLPKK